MTSLPRLVLALAAVASALSACSGSQIPDSPVKPPPASCKLENITGLAPTPDSERVKKWQETPRPVDTSTNQPLQGDKLLSHCTNKLQNFEQDYCGETTDKYCNTQCKEALTACIDTHRSDVLRQCSEQTYPVFARAYAACCQTKLENGIVVATTTPCSG